MTCVRRWTAGLLAAAGCAWWIQSVTVADQDLPKRYPRPIVIIGGRTWTFDLRNGRADDALSPRIATTGPVLAISAPSALQAPGDDGFWTSNDTAGAAALVERLARSCRRSTAGRFEASASESRSG
jgi:hypothetical protein